MRPERKFVVTLLTLAAGAMDATTGALLVAAPAKACALFGATLPPGDDTAMRFVGAFVAGVGASYLWALASTRPATRALRLPGVWSATAVVRACVAIFVISAVSLGRLDPAWLLVGATDAALAGAQTWMLWSGWLDR